MEQTKTTSQTITDASDKRAAILKTTLKLLSERGLADTPMSVIVKESGVSTGTVYHYFETKDELILDLYHEIKVKTFDSLLAGFDTEASYQEQFLYLWKAAVRFYIGHPMEMKFLEQFENSPYHDASHAMKYHELLTPILTFFEQGRQEEVLKDLPMQVLMTLGMSSAMALVKQHMGGGLELTDELIDSAALASWDSVRR
jgi:AcrR family transcriptional regulator